MISLGDRNWKQFKIKNIANIKQSKRYSKKNRYNGNMPYVERSINNNGITDFISVKNNTPKSFYKNVIAVNASGAPGYAFYHPYTAYFADGVDVICFKHLNWAIGLFISTCIRQQHTQFNYGFELYNAQLEQLKINLPINNNGKPDWEFMTDYMKQVRNKIPKQNIHNIIKAPSISLNSRLWKQFKIKDIGQIQQSKRYAKKDRSRGNIPYIERSANNNGITDFITFKSNTPDSFYKNVIAVNASGAPGYAFYHYHEAYFADGVDVIKFKHLNLNIGLFISTCIRQQRHQFNYGFELYDAQLKELKINLPSDKEGKPDWEFMNNYMKSMLN